MKLFPWCVFIVGFMFLSLLEGHYQPLSRDGVYFQWWTSDTMLQCLPAQQLRETPFESLFYLHKEPPMLDVIRAGVVQFFKNVPVKNLCLSIDKVLYLIWALFFSAMVTLVYVWVKKLSSPLVAVIASIGWMLHPSAIFYATLLETTFLSSLLTVWVLYELWRIYRCSRTSIVRLALACVLTFYTRSSFQWYFLVLLVISLALLMAPRRHLILFICILACLIGPYMIKQYVLFKTVSTNTAVGYILCGDIRYRPSTADLEVASKSLVFNYPKKAAKYSANDSRNSENQYKDNLMYTEIFKKRLLSHPVESIHGVWVSFTNSLKKYWLASFRYHFESNIILRHLPSIWINLYEVVLANYCLLIMLLISIGTFIYSKFKYIILFRQIRKIVGLALPVLYIFISTNLSNRSDAMHGSDWTDPHRYKFFLEPFFYIFIVSQLYVLFQMLKRRFFKS